MTEQRVDRNQIELTRKRRMRTADRLLGWFTLFCYFYPLIGRYLNAQGTGNYNESNMQTFSNLFWLAIFLHAIANMYLYGIPNFNGKLRVINMYFGLAMLLIIFVNRSVSRLETLERITATLIIIPAVLHALVSIWFAFQRLIRKVWNEPMPFYTGGNVSRDV